jgi:hypothetical protein
VPSRPLHVNGHVEMFAKHSRLGLAAALAVVGLLSAAGCGSSSSSSSTTTTGESAASQRTSWANGVCGALVSWESALKSTGSQLKSGTPSKSSVQDAASQAKSTTQTLVDTLKGLGKPPSPAADQAKQTVDQLGSELSKDVDSIKSAAGNVSSPQDLKTAATSVGSTLSTMKTQVSSAVNELKSLDPNGAWKQAFSQADSCTTLTSS